MKAAAPQSMDMKGGSDQKGASWDQKGGPWDHKGGPDQKGGPMDMKKQEQPEVGT